MSISAVDVMNLRKSTGVGMMEAKKALVEADGDIDKAIEELRKRAPWATPAPIRTRRRIATGGSRRATTNTGTRRPRRPVMTRS